MDETLPEASDATILHGRLLAGDPTATAMIAERYLEPLTHRLLQARRDVSDTQLVQDAVIEALMDYLRHPGRYEPERASLETYLFMAAKADLKNALAKERRHSLRAISLDDDPAPAVELSLAARNDSVEDIVIERMGVALPSGLDRAQALRMIAQEFPDPSDRRLLSLILDGERHSVAFARILGVSELADGDQRRIVKRHKDRIQVRLRRLRNRLNILPFPRRRHKGGAEGGAGG